MSENQEDFIKNEFRRISYSVMRRYIEEKMCVPCEDRPIGVIGGEVSAFIESFDMSNVRDRILLILESPHIYEYKGATPRAALGKTGYNITGFANQVFSLYDGWGLWVINAIEYPCSLFQDIRQTRDIIRDVVISKMWRLNEVRDSLKKRIECHCGDRRNLIVEASGYEILTPGIAHIVEQLAVNKRFISKVPHPCRWFDPMVRDDVKLLVESGWMSYGLTGRSSVS